MIPESPVPGIVFFFGGGWISGTPEQFFPHCRYLSERGMVAASAEYRIRDSHGTDPAACVRDGKSALTWLFAHAEEFGIDADQLLAGGGSAGGQVAAASTFLSGFRKRERRGLTAPMVWFCLIR